ncbi:MAG: carboxymuconolactone decarboxylase family protein [Xylophilus ampelinus]
MGEYLRYRSSLGPRLSELAILVTARHWSQQVEWAIHAPIAEREGISAQTIESLAKGKRPTSMAAVEAVIYGFYTELHETQMVSDACWARAIEYFGEAGAVDLIGVTGYYTFLSMVINASRTTVPTSEAKPLEPLGK